MNPAIPDYINLAFTLTTLYGIWLFKKAFNPSQTTFLVLFVWLVLQAYLSYSGFYKDTTTIPPKFALSVIPALLLILGFFISKKGQAFMDGISIEALHWIHTIRIPVELILWSLFVAEQIPKIMTFGGRNYDIIAGLTAPLLVYYGIRRPIIDKGRMLLWNFLGLFLLLNIVVMAILSVASPLQQIAFDRPNKAILEFPIVWLPSFIVPLVLFSHLVSIRQLLKKKP
ncbi:MAG: hypothetical protein ACI9IP_002364 [Arcticibacterium sp.]|jgi:hypothetical protein